jgi:hypothetical protein
MQKEYFTGARIISASRENTHRERAKKKKKKKKIANTGL